MNLQQPLDLVNPGEIELADVNGQVENLLQNQDHYASQLLSEREFCVLLKVTRSLSL